MAITLMFASVMAIGGASCVFAAEPSPGWVINARAVPTNFTADPGVFPDGYTLVVRNAGSEPTDGAPVTITDELPPGVTATGVEEAFDAGPGFETLGQQEQHHTPLSCVVGGSVVSCTDSNVVEPGDLLDVAIVVDVAPGTPSGGMNVVKVSGGGAPLASLSEPTTVSAEPPSYGLESFTSEATGVDGQADTQAGDHPYEFTTSYYLNVRHKNEFALEAVPVEESKDFVVDLPAGFVGDPQVVQKCDESDAISRTCPPSTQIGVATIDTFGLNHSPSGNQQVAPIYNVVPDAGVPAQFEFDIAKSAVTLYVSVSQETNYAVRVTVSGIPREGQVTGVSVTFFGEPLTDRNIYNQSVGALPLAFLQNPVDCAAGPQQARVSTDSWQHPGSFLADGAPDLSDPRWKTMSTTVYPSLTGCDMLQFEPAISVTPETTQADEPTGLTVDLHVPQAPGLSPDLATPELENATVTLPAGLSISPSAADGLKGCGNGEIALSSPEAGTCPDASVLGTVKIATPLLASPLEGQVYLGTPGCDPCTSADAADGNMLRIFIEAQGAGVRIKKEGKIYANPSTGQLTTKFEDNPDLPFEDLELHFKSGLRAGLATPQACGAATTSSDLVPWSSPITPDANPSSSFNVDWDGNGGSCPASMPFAPSFSAGTSNPNAGQFSPFTLTFGREDREQDLSQIQVHMPPGLLGMLSSVPLCEESQAQQGTCGEASRIGSMTVAAGPGTHPFYEKGSIYLTESYGGAPFGLSIVVPTIAGPFNLGNVVVRAKINVDPQTAALTVTSDPFPQVIDGIPLRLRTANVTIERPGFIFNPTSCEQQHVTATITGAQGAQANVSAPFAVAGCAGLHFGPTFTASTSGRTSKADGASLDVKLTLPTGAQSNIAKVKVDLPKQLPSRLTTLQKACTAATFEANPAACPTASLIGTVKALTPVLPVALTGPVYFVSHGGEAFPSLIAVLQGDGVRVNLIGATFISKAGITSSTFENVPDVPVSSFQLYLPEGPYSALATNGSLCAGKLAMPTSFIAQDGAQLKQNTKVTVTGCPKTKAKVKKKKKKKKAKKADHTYGDGRKS